jgi:hypothetical protein
MIEVPPNEHLGRRGLRLARRNEPDEPKVLEKLMQGGARVGIAALAASTRPTRQERTDARLVELGDRDPRVSHPSNEGADRSPLVVLRRHRVAGLRERREEFRQMNVEPTRDRGVRP